MVSRTLVVCHRNGVRLYRERCYEDPDNSPDAQQQTGVTSSGIFELVEARNEFRLRDAYLCVGAQPTLHEDKIVSSVYSRYFCVATGNDRTPHSVCVMSTAGHFVLHHELHANHRIVAMHLSVAALESMHDSRRTPLVLSIDEVGGVCVYDVARDAAVRLMQLPVPLCEWVEDANAAGKREGAMSLSCPSTEAMIADYLCSPHTRTEDYYVEGGVVTQAVLTGPCVEFCKHCGNLFSLGGKEAKGFVAMSAFVTSRANDVRPPHPATSSDTATSLDSAPQDAALLVTYIRFIWSPQGAYVWHERSLVREVAPVDVGEKGPALHHRPYHVGRPLTVLIGRPRLRLWRVQACTGHVLETRRVYEDAEGSGLGSRSAREYFVNWIPLGRHALRQHPSVTWFCVAALTGDGTLLLLGQSPQDVATPTVEVNPSGEHYTRRSTPMQLEAEAQERIKLESWLDGVEALSPPAETALSCSPVDSVMELVPVEPSAAVSSGICTKAYTVLMELYTPHRRRVFAESPLRPDVDAAVRCVIPNLSGNYLLLFLQDWETITRVSLPFESSVEPIAESLQIQRTGAVSTSTPPVRVETLTTDQSAEPAPFITTSIWDSTIGLINPSRWMPRGVFASTEASGYPLHHPQPNGPEPTEVPREPRPVAFNAYGLNLVRPLVSAVHYLTHEKDTAPATVATLRSPKEPSTPLDHARSSGADSHCTLREEGSGEMPSSSPCASGRSSLAPPSLSTGGISSRRVEAVFIQLKRDGPRRSGELKRRSHDDDRHSNASAVTRHPSHSPSELRDYAKQQVQSILQSEDMASSSPTNQREAVLYYHIHARLSQLEKVEEPQERSAQLNHWKDAHNSLYIAFSLGRDAIEDVARTARAAHATHKQQELLLYLRPVLEDARERGTYSTGFFAQYQDICERHLKDPHSDFDCAAFFESDGPLHAVMTQQEQDRCRYELEDLRLKHAAALELLDPTDTVVIYANEERIASAAGNRWVPHHTFPYDDVDGTALDLLRLNAEPDARDPSNWSWVSVERSCSAANDRVQYLRRELQGWSVGPWQYADRWPSAAESAFFEWSASEALSSQVRRRMLTRRRVYQPRLRERERLAAAQAKEQEALRMELGL